MSDEDYAQERIGELIPIGQTLLESIAKSSAFANEQDWALYSAWRAQALNFLEEILSPSDQYLAGFRTEVKTRDIIKNEARNRGTFYDTPGLSQCIRTGLTFLVALRHDIAYGSMKMGKKHKQNDVGIERERAFIIMSINKEDLWLEDVHGAIKEVCKTFDLIAERSDDIEHSGSISSKIKERIKMAGVVIADLSYDRPNVYYELGYAHGLGRDEDVILLAKKDPPLHFDIQDLNVIIYENMTQLKSKLTKRLDVVLKKEQ